MADIIVIEDDPQISQIIRRILEGRGHAVRSASDGRAGVLLYRSAPADLVITDVYMPGQDGIETTMELRADFPDVRILVLSRGARDGPERTLEDARLLRATRAIAKPFTARELVEAVTELLG